MTEREPPNSRNPGTDDSAYSNAPQGLRGVRRFRIDGSGKEHMEMARSRTLVAAALFVIGFLVFALRLLDLGFLEHVSETNAAGDRRGASLAARADIVDRNGVVLATNLSTASLYADPKRVLDPIDAADKLVLALPGLNHADVLHRLKGEGRFAWIKRNLTPQEQWRVNNLGIPGLGFEQEDRRVYPQGRLAAHVLGFVDIDGNGLSGIERSFNSRLSSPAEVGAPLALSLDMRIQHVLREEVAATVNNFSALGGAGMVLDVRSGEVVAMVSLPDFDPNDPGSANTDTLFNRVVQGVYELGSGLKAFTVAMALDSGVSRINSSYDATHPLKVSRFTINDDHGKGRWLSLPEVFIYSSNIGTARIALDLGTAKQRGYLGRLGLLQKPEIELLEAAEPLVPNPWREINTMTIAFGHGLAITPLHLAAGISTVVNGGRHIPATLLRKDAGLRDDSAGTRILSAETSATMRRLLRLVVVSGTGSKADAPGYEVGGKTGTAEKSVNGRYKRKALISSFVGAFPLDDPRYVVLIIVDEPKGTKETYGFASGGWTAAPAVGRVVSRIGPMLGVVPRQNEDKQELRNAYLVPVGGQ